MSALQGTNDEPTIARRDGMSTLPPKPDMCSAKRHVRFVPIADIVRDTNNVEDKTIATLAMRQRRDCLAV